MRVRHEDIRTATKRNCPCFISSSRLIHRYNIFFLSHVPYIFLKRKIDIESVELLHGEHAFHEQLLTVFFCFFFADDSIRRANYLIRQNRLVSPAHKLHTRRQHDRHARFDTAQATTARHVPEIQILHAIHGLSRLSFRFTTNEHERDRQARASLVSNRLATSPQGGAPVFLPDFFFFPTGPKANGINNRRRDNKWPSSLVGNPSCGSMYAHILRACSVRSSADEEFACARRRCCQHERRHSVVARLRTYPTQKALAVFNPGPRVEPCSFFLS